MKKLIAMLLALVMVLALAACTPAEKTPGTTAATNATTEATTAATEEATEGTTQPAGEVMTYEQYAAAELKTPVVIESCIQAVESWWDGVMNLYLQDEVGAYYVYKLACTEEESKALVPGVTVRISGYKDAWSGEVEIIDATYEIIEGAEPVKVEATDATKVFGSDMLADLMNYKVLFQGLTVAASKDANGNEAAFLYKWDGSGQQGDDLYFNVSLGETTYTFTVNAYMVGTGADSEVYKAVEALHVGDKIDVEGFLYWYEGAQTHVTAVKAAA